eukprot:TRINITY_DN16528_c0_g1_i1.p1 TRINITY_DN16528_c0_g1~~TRINITY_DN16528_c0_g1_i1.p1  ORF type:complete len:814 (+),score=165.43 TRINITY_DN16528_c0_g1_i1:191-2632(+)
MKKTPRTSSVQPVAVQQDEDLDVEDGQAFTDYGRQRAVTEDNGNRRRSRTSTVGRATQEEAVYEIRQLLRQNRSDMAVLGRRLREDLREDFQFFAHEFLKGQAICKYLDQSDWNQTDGETSSSGRGRCRKKADTPLPAGPSSYQWREEESVVPTTPAVGHKLIEEAHFRDLNTQSYVKPVTSNGAGTASPVWAEKAPWSKPGGRSSQENDWTPKPSGRSPRDVDRTPRPVGRPLAPQEPANSEFLREGVAVPVDPPPVLPLHTPMAPAERPRSESKISDRERCHESDRALEAESRSEESILPSPACSDGAETDEENPLNYGQSNRLSLTRELAKAKRALKEKKPMYRMSVQELLTSSKFDNLVGLSIFLNAMVIGVQTEVMARGTTDEVPEEFQVLEYVFGAWFTLELSLRLYVLKLEFFAIGGPGWGWNYFDFAVVFAQIMEMFAELWQTVGGIDPKNFKLLRILRILRLVRILRVLRVLHLISELRTIVSSIVGSFSSLGWTVVLLSLMIYIVAVYFTQTVNTRMVEVSPESGIVLANLDEEQLALKSKFGSLFRAILTLWEAISGGIDWDDLANPLLQEIGSTTCLLFVMYIAFALLALLNVVTGVFVQTALNSAKKEEDGFMTNQIIGLFNVVERRTDAKITFQQVTKSLENTATAKEWKSVGVAAEEARYLFRLLDIHNEGCIKFEEFLSGCLRLNGPAKAVDLLTVMQEARFTTERLWTRVDKMETDLKEVLSSMTACAGLSELLSKIDVEQVVSDFGTMMEAILESRQTLKSVKTHMMNGEGAMAGIYGDLENLVSALIPQHVSLV